MKDAPAGSMYYYTMCAMRSVLCSLFNVCNCCGSEVTYEDVQNVSVEIKLKCVGRTAYPMHIIYVQFGYRLTYLLHQYIAHAKIQIPAAHAACFSHGTAVSRCWCSSVRVTSGDAPLSLM